MLPSTVFIEYTTRKPVFEVEYDDIYLVTDIEGCILSTRKEHKLGFTRISGLNLEGYQLGYIIRDNVIEFEYASKIYTVLEWYDRKFLTALRESINWIDLSNPQEIALMYDNRFLVKLSYGENISHQTEDMCEILSQHIGSSDKGTLDLTLSEAPIISYE